MILYLLFHVQNCLVTLIFALKLSSRQFPDKFGQHLLTQRWFFCCCCCALSSFLYMHRDDCANRAVWDFLQKWLIYQDPCIAKIQDMPLQCVVFRLLSILPSSHWTLTGNLYSWGFSLSSSILPPKQRQMAQMNLERGSISVAAATLPSHLPWFYNWEWKLPKVIFQKAITRYSCHWLLPAGWFL